MKYIAIFLIMVYQVTLSPLLKSINGTNRFCRYEVSCSNFTIQSIKKYGVIKGISLGFVRLLSCQPFFSVSHIKTIHN